MNLPNKFAALVLAHLQESHQRVFLDLMEEKITDLKISKRFETGSPISQDSFTVSDLEELHDKFAAPLVTPKFIEISVTFDRPFHLMQHDLVRIFKRERKERERQRWNKKRRNK